MDFTRNTFRLWGLGLHIERVTAFGHSRERRERVTGYEIWTSDPFTTVGAILVGDGSSLREAGDCARTRLLAAVA